MISYMKKAVTEAHAPKGELIPMLLKNLSKPRKDRSHKTVHASDITKPDFCPRQYALMDIHNIERGYETIAPALRATFDVGNMTSDLVREQWFGQAAVGNWRCQTCKAKVTMLAKPEGGCTGKDCNWRYEEVNFVDPETKVSGSIDVLADLKGTKLVAVELKIIKPEDFEKLQAPLAEHRERTKLYLRLIASANNYATGVINTNVAKVLYVSRGFGKKNPEHGQIMPFKEYDVTRNDASIEYLLDKPRALQFWREGKGPMPEGVCSTPSCPAAKKCLVRKQCFSGENP